MRLLQAEVLRRSAPYQHLAVWEASQSAGLVAAQRPGLGLASILDIHVRRVLLQPLMSEPGAAPDRPTALDVVRIRLQNGFTAARDDVLPAVLYLAVRAARRALAANPDDAQAWVDLGESYLRLLHATRERDWGHRLPELLQLRQTQASTALNQAIALKPGHAQAHLLLGGLYKEMGCLDLAVRHLTTYQQLLGTAALETKEGEHFQSDLARLAKEVEKRQQAHESQSSGREVLDRARLAERKGLAGKARDLLLESHVSAFGHQGMELELELLLKTGRAKEVLDWTTPEQKEGLREGYHWLRARAEASLGNYGRAEEECTQLSRTLASGPNGQPVQLPRNDRPADRAAGA